MAIQRAVDSAQRPAISLGAAAAILVGVTGTYSYSPDDHAGLDKRSVTMIEVTAGKFMPPTH